MSHKATPTTNHHHALHSTMVSCLWAPILFTRRYQRYHSYFLFLYLLRCFNSIGLSYSSQPVPFFSPFCVTSKYTVTTVLSKSHTHTRVHTLSCAFLASHHLLLQCLPFFPLLHTHHNNNLSLTNHNNIHTPHHLMSFSSNHHCGTKSTLDLLITSP